MTAKDSTKRTAKQTFGVSGREYAIITTNILVSKWWIYNARQEKLVQDSIKTYSQANFSWQRQEIRHYHNKYFGVRV